ncbi:MAG TPA: MFS transporter [Vicinamibacteria bacterium]|nr:MFS transporter [Vicinamibacteria bacterium]
MATIGLRGYTVATIGRRGYVTENAPPLTAEPAPRLAGIALPAFLSAFAYRNFRLIWTGAFLSSIGTWTQDVALAWLIFTRLHDPFYLGLRAFASDAPLLAFMLLGGAVADRVDRRRILIISNVLQMALAAALGLLYATGNLGIIPILVIAALTGLTQSQSAPTYQAVITSLVPPRQIPNAVALNSLQFNLSRAIGPAIAGLLLARAGTGACFAVNAISFLAVIVAVIQIELPSAPAPKGTLGESLRAGLRHVAHDPLLSSLTLLGAAGALLAFPLITYLPVIAGDVLKTGVGGFSALLSSFGAGAIAGAVTTAHRGHVPRRGRTMLAALLVYGVTVTAAMASRFQILSMALLFVAGASLVTAFSTLNSLVQENAPGDLKGRILSIYGLAFRSGTPLGALIAGALVRSLGAPRVLGAFAALLALLALSNLAWNVRVRDL